MLFVYIKTLFQLFGYVVLHALGLRAGVVVAVPFKQVDDTPNCETRTESDYESLENTYCTVEKLHDFFAGIIFAQVKISR